MCKFKSLLHKYFCFISCTLNILQEYNNCVDTCKKIADVCKSASDPVSVYIASIVKVCIEFTSEFILYTNHLFDTVIGYNPLLSPCDNSPEVLDISKDDYKCLNVVGKKKVFLETIAQDSK